MFQLKPTPLSVEVISLKVYFNSKRFTGEFFPLSMEINELINGEKKLRNNLYLLIYFYCTKFVLNINFIA